MRSTFRAIFFAVALTASAPMLSACSSQLQQAYSDITSAQVSTNQMLIARNAFNAAEVLATNYLRLPRCTGSNGPVCRSPSTTPVLIQTMRTGRVARNNLTAFMKAHPGQLGTQGLVDAVTSSTNAINQMLATYRANAPT